VSQTNPPSPPAQASTAAVGTGGTVAFAGLGTMGCPMARRVAATFPLTVWNRTRARAEAMSGVAARIAATPYDAARGARVVVTCVADAKALQDLMAGETGLLAGLDPGAVVVDMSTIGRAAAREAARAVEAAGGSFVDAPVSGSVGPATRGELLALVGGSDADVARATPVLQTMCSRILRAGGVGQGQALKVVLNGLGTYHFVAFASMLALGERAGLTREALLDAFTSGAFATPSYVAKRDRVLARDYGKPDFTLALALKDGALNVALQQEVGLPLPVQREMAREVAQAIGEGLGEDDLYGLERHFSHRR
jgi:3-hydroxyisobutyrate dehydrogenase